MSESNFVLSDAALDALSQVRAHLETTTTDFSMRSWAVRLACGTTRCIAGMMVGLQGWEPVLNSKVANTYLFKNGLETQDIDKLMYRLYGIRLWCKNVAAPGTGEGWLFYELCWPVKVKTAVQAIDLYVAQFGPKKSKGAGVEFAEAAAVGVGK